MSKVVQEVKETVKEGVHSIKEKLENIEVLGKLISSIKGTQDINTRARVLLDPSKPETSTNLNSNQIDFVSVSLTICDYFPEFEGLEKFAKEFLLTSISKDGWGVDRVIQYEQAISEKRLVQLGIRPGQERQTTEKGTK